MAKPNCSAYIDNTYETYTLKDSRDANNSALHRPATRLTDDYSKVPRSTCPTHAHMIVTSYESIANQNKQCTRSLIDHRIALENTSNEKYYFEGGASQKNKTFTNPNILEV